MSFFMFAKMGKGQLSSNDERFWNKIAEHFLFLQHELKSKKNDTYELQLCNLFQDIGIKLNERMKIN